MGQKTQPNRKRGVFRGAKNKKTEPLCVKRFHGKMQTENACLPLIAPHKVHCDSPADILRRPSIAGHRQTGSASAVFPFPCGGCLALPRGTFVYRASIKRFSFTHGSTGADGCQACLCIFYRFYKGSAPIWQKIVALYPKCRAGNAFRSRWVGNVCLSAPSGRPAPTGGILRCRGRGPRRPVFPQNTDPSL